MGSFKYAFRDGARLIFRHIGLSLLTLLTSTAVFFLIGSSVLFVLNARHVVSMLESELAIQVYLKPGSNLEQAAEKAHRITPVRTVKIITPEVALEKLRSRLGNQSSAVTLLDKNPLPPSLEILVDKADSVTTVASELYKLNEVVDDIVYSGKLAEKLTRLSYFASQFSIIMLLVAISASGVVLFNTIRISVYSKEEEIAVMLMVGATPTYVALPFVIQGVVLGALGSVCASVMLAFGYNVFLNGLRELLPFLPFLEGTIILLRLSVILIGAGATVSLIASLLAVERFISRALKPL